MSSLSYKLRLWQEDDREFLFALLKETMYESITATLGWDEIWQRDNFEQRLTAQIVEVIEVQSLSVGSLWWEWLPESLYLHQLSILPSYQGRGLGTALIEKTLSRAKQQDKNVTLSVLEANPRAKELYERLGFIVTRVESPFIRMTSDIDRGQSTPCNSHNI